MSKVNVLNELLDWSLDRPPWQRDALRRLVTNGQLNAEDLRELADLCKSRHGLCSKSSAVPLEKRHFSQPGKKDSAVSLESLTHHSGVNALAQDQTIDFGSGLTVIYGGNAAGKSGYIRILKRACRARGSEEILGNVVAATTPGRPSATIKYSSHGELRTLLWDDDQMPNLLLPGVSVFDRHCASVYISEQTDVAFRPWGLDLFDKLSAACEGVKRLLDQERRALESHRFRFPDVDPGTSVHELITGLTSLTNSESVKEMASLTTEEITRIGQLRTRIRDFESGDPRNKARTIELQANRMKGLVEGVQRLSNMMSDSHLERLFAARDRMNETRRAVEEIRSRTLGSQPVCGTGSGSWRNLWHAAERFSKDDAYPSEEFPFVGVGSRCVLCQDKLTVDSKRRLRQFDEFLNSSIQREHDAASRVFNETANAISGAVVVDEASDQALDELQLVKPELASTIRDYLTDTDARKKQVTEALSKSLKWSPGAYEGVLDIEALVSCVNGLRERSSVLRRADTASTVARMNEELTELTSRQVLSDHLGDVIDEIERKKKIAAYQLCIDETRTNAITRKSSDLTKRAVTEQLTASFQRELNSLRFHHIEVDMVAAGGSRGALYHRLQLRRAPGVAVPRIVSEGEARCLSVASFFAELSTSADKSAILFDDPVSSLDHNWRGNVAKRLAVESTSRQVIVFTHDVVFVLALLEEASMCGAEVTHQCLRRDRHAAGLSSSQLPWVAMNVRDRIGHMKDLWQAAEKRYRDGAQMKYERDAAYIYGLLRESWERGVEEVLLGGAVERYRNSVHTLRVSALVDISEDDCNKLKEGMTKCSRWLTGHDQSGADNAPIPEPTELSEDINMLEDWVLQIRRRR